MSGVATTLYGLRCDCCGLAPDPRHPSEISARESLTQHAGWRRLPGRDGHVADYCARCAPPEHDTRWCHRSDTT